MFIERRVNQTTGAIELWRCQWVNQPGTKPHKESIRKIGYEQPLSLASQTAASEVAAICWSHGRSLGNIAVHSPALVGRFPAESGDDALLPCSFVNAGKFRHGADRWWCQTHQTHWGTKGDIQSSADCGEMRCANYAQTMSYVIHPPTIDPQAHAEVALWCSMPAAISTETISRRAPRLHVHVKDDSGRKLIDQDFRALSIRCSGTADLFGNKAISFVNITPPAAFEFVCALEEEREVSCIDCSHCGYPHLDLADFARKPHRKHFCGNCGRDSTIAAKPIVSTPLLPLHQRYAANVTYQVPDRELDLDQYKHCAFSIWASTPAIIWTSNRAQEFGLHVHVHDGSRRIIDETFGRVVLNNETLDRSLLVGRMIERSIV